MPRNKLRVEVALYARPKFPGTYHYALFVAPKGAKKGPATKHHVKNTLFADASGEWKSPWRYEQTTIANVEAEQLLLVRVIGAKVATSRRHVQQILERVPVLQVDDPDVAAARSFSCLTWVRDVWEALRAQGAMTGEADGWEDVQRKALEYVAGKLEQGRWRMTWEGGSGVPSLDLLKGKEVVK